MGPFKEFITAKGVESKFYSMMLINRIIKLSNKLSINNKFKIINTYMSRIGNCDHRYYIFATYLHQSYMEFNVPLCRAQTGYKLVKTRIHYYYYFSIQSYEILKVVKVS